MKANRNHWARLSWPALIAMLATAIVAMSASAATGPPRTRVARPSAARRSWARSSPATPVAWTGTTPIAFTYQWVRCTSTGTSCANIDEAAQSQHYVLTSDDRRSPAPGPRDGHELVRDEQP